MVLVLLVLLAVLGQPAAGLDGLIPVPANSVAPLGTDVAPVLDEMRIESLPTVTGFSPATGYRGSTVYATMVGTGFATGARVRISGGGQTIEATNVNVIGGTSTLAVCDLAIPATAYVGTWDVEFQNPGSTTWVSKAGAFAVQDAPTPTITGIMPNPIYRGSVTNVNVIVQGTNFVRGAQVVLTGGGQTVEADLESVEEYGESIHCSVFFPNNAYLGSWGVKVQNPGTTTWITKSNVFTVMDSPTITSISPSSAPRGSTVTATVTGTNFGSGMTLRVSGANTTFWATGVTLISPNQFRCTLTIPANAYVGGYFVSIGNPGATYSVEYPAGLFTVTSGATPTPTPTPSPTATPTPTPTPTPTVTEAYAVVKVWGSSGTGPGQFQAPGGIAIDPAGNVYVADPGNNRVQKFDRNGTFLSRIGGVGSPPAQQLVGPSGVTVDRGGTVYVADTGNNRVQAFDMNLTFLSQMGIGGLGGVNLGQMFGPQGIAVDGAGRVHIADTGNNRTQTFAANGTPLSFLGAPGGLGGFGIGQFLRPSGIAVDAANSIYVADTGNNRVQVFNPDGSFAGQIGGTGSAIGQVIAPQGVAVDNQSNVYVADTGNNRVQKYAKNGTYLGQVGGRGQPANGSSVRADTTAPGVFSAPGGVAIDGSGNVYVADTGNDRVQVFAPLASSPALLVPGGAGLPTDTNGDGLYDDVNGNGRKDFADVVLFFNQMTWIAANEPIGCFDFNNNGRIDFADVVWLFNHL
jgi:sugar lactone lactonase YvrE